MTAPETKVDGDLAWAISSWPGSGPGDELTREGIESLTRFLTSQGFGKVKENNDPWLADVKGVARVVDNFRNLASEYLKGPSDRNS